MKRILLGIAFVLALAFAPKANAYPFACSGNLIGNIVICGNHCDLLGEPATTARMRRSSGFG